jgi:hypothetical protein
MTHLEVENDVKTDDASVFEFSVTSVKLLFSYKNSKKKNFF